MIQKRKKSLMCYNSRDGIPDWIFLYAGVRIFFRVRNIFSSMAIHNPNERPRESIEALGAPLTQSR